MNDRLKEALTALKALDPSSLSPVAFANVREDVLIQGLQGLAEEYGKSIGPTRIDGNGEFAFNIIGDDPTYRQASGQYGPELAAWLSQIPRRTGTMPTTAAVLPENGWCRINHFDAERLLHLVADKLLAPEVEATAAAPGMH